MVTDINPAVLREVASCIVNSYVQIYEQVNVLDSALKTFGNTLDDEAYTNISTNVTRLTKHILEYKQDITTVCNKLIEYAAIVEQSRSETSGVL